MLEPIELAIIVLLVIELVCALFFLFILHRLQKKTKRLLKKLRKKSEGGEKMKTEHYTMRRLDKFLEENPSASWANEWIDCLSYYCGCPKCIENLKANDVDIDMLDRIFSFNRGKTT